MSTVRLLAHGEIQETHICPNCHADWRGKDIFDVLRTQDWCKDKSDDELRLFVKESYSPPYQFSRLIGIQYDYGDYRHRDGVSAWQCPDCQHVFPRDLGEHTLKPEEVQCKKQSS